MATFRLPIIGFATRPDDTGNCWFEPQDILATNDIWDRMVCRFGGLNGDDATQPTTRFGFHGAFDIPKNYVGSPLIVIVWASTKTSGVVVWDFEYRAVGGDDTESFDQAGTQELVSVSDTAGSAAWERMNVNVALTAGNLAVDDHVSFFFARDGLDGTDTLAGSALLFQLIFEYQDA